MRWKLCPTLSPIHAKLVGGKRTIRTLKGAAIACPADRAILAGERRGYNYAMDDTDNKELWERLIRLGAPRLANALLYLSSRLNGAAEYVEALLLTPEEAHGRKRSFWLKYGL